MMIGQEQLMKMKSKSKVEVEERPGIFWRVCYGAFYLWLAAVVGLCAWIAIF